MIQKFTCPCGKEYSFPPGLIGPPLTCKCGRQYNSPRIDLPTLIRRVDELERELAEVRAKLAGGIVLPGWTCPSCRGFNGAEKERLSHCRGCGAAAPAIDGDNKA